MTVLVCGSRTWGDPVIVHAALSRLGFKAEDQLVHGAARGADTMAGQWAAAFGLKTIWAHPADWARFGKSAGMKRNQEMLDAHPDIVLVVAFAANLPESRGTYGMVKLAQARGIPVIHVRNMDDALAIGTHHEH